MFSYLWEPFEIFFTCDSPWSYVRICESLWELLYRFYKIKFAISVNYCLNWAEIFLYVKKWNSLKTDIKHKTWCVKNYELQKSTKPYYVKNVNH